MVEMSVFSTARQAFDKCVNGGLAKLTEALDRALEQGGEFGGIEQA